jgi:maltose alpha-D-glucosyltransferase/alpha-amylase
MGDYIEMVGLLGRRIAEMHLALASRPDDPVFAPEPSTDFYRRSLYHGMLAEAMRSFELLRAMLSQLPEGVRTEGGQLLEREPEVLARFQKVRDRRIPVTRIRVHSDLHLGEVLHTGKDFVIVDFEGDPSRPLGQRRLKRNALRDVATMLRSLHYAAHSALFGEIPGVIARQQAADALRRWAEFWSHWANAAFLSGYLEAAGSATFLPSTTEDLRVLLEMYLLERALVELRHELSERREWATIAMHGIKEILDAPAAI